MILSKLPVHKFLNEVTCEGYQKGLQNAMQTIKFVAIDDCQTYITDDSNMGYHFHNSKPDSNIFCSFSNSSSCLTNKLLSIKSNFHPIV